MKRSKKIIISLIFIMIIYGLFFMDLGLATNEEEPVLCTITSEYKAWEKLSDKEKAETIMPAMCDSKADNININYRYFSFDVKAMLPATYDGRNQSYKPIIKNQNNTNGCWAFSTTTALESYTKKKLNLDYIYSTRHIEYSATRKFKNGEINDHGFDREVGSGGNYFMSSSYLINGYGAIKESEMPFENNENEILLSAIQNKNTIVDVNNLVLKNGTYGDKCTTTEIEDIKKLVMENGAVAVTTYLSTASSYYNSSTSAYYYNGTKDINHAVTIVGWNDNYSQTNFSSSNRPTSNGAWIVQNSYDTWFGDNGYYYISYEDVHICDIYMSITDVDTEIEDNSYILDKLGYISYMGYGSATATDDDYTIAYAMNVFTKEASKTEKLKEITFGTNGTGTYEIYYKKGNAGKSSVTTMTLIGSGDIPYNGYITHKLEEPIILDKDVTDFSIAIKYDMDTSTRPVPTSTASSSKYKYITIEEGKTFISHEGNSWTDLSKRTYPTIASIKAFTDDVDYELTLDNYHVNFGDEITLKIAATTRNIDKNNLTIKLIDNKSKEINLNNISYTNENNTLKYIDFNLPSSTPNNTYTLIVYYNNEEIDRLNIEINTNMITSNKYRIDQIRKIIYVDPLTDITTLKNNLSQADDILYNNNKVTSGLVKTGMTLTNYLIVVKGDVTNDGYVKMNDVMKISEYIVEEKGLNDTEKYAADVTNDAKIKMNDVMKISEYIVEGGNL
ncbi:MAG: hypothetical protein IJN90_03505 [Bacilli bacterium]|nr:hypothetical protein [Bacilli bacterium]